MLFTKECDYAVRVLRALSNGEKLNVQDISDRELMSMSITYKVTRKLEQAGFLTSYRGINGGYTLRKSLDTVTLYDVISIIDKDLFVTDCVNHKFVCGRNPETAPCMVHKEFCRLQGLIYRELTSKTLAQILKESNELS